MLRLALVGYGRMGRAVAALAAERGHQVQTVIRSAENGGGAALNRDRLGAVEAVLEFTRPEAAVSNLVRLAPLRIPVITGTTGWSARLGEVSRAFIEQRSALLHSPNFSVGVQLFLRAARDVAGRFAGHAGFDGFIVETHHAAKLDAPSGTALRLQTAARAADPDRHYPISSVRGGAMPGVHTLIFDAPEETVRLEHEARGRQAFAAGALSAAEWLIGREGVFTFEEMLFGREP